MNIYVGNLPFNLGEEDLKEIFEEYGEVSSVKIINDKFTGRSKGFGFVEMDSDDEANNAIKELNNDERFDYKLKSNIKNISPEKIYTKAKYSEITPYPVFNKVYSPKYGVIDKELYDNYFN